MIRNLNKAADTFTCIGECKKNLPEQARFTNVFQIELKGMLGGGGGGGECKSCSLLIVAVSRL
jgi:hypothetical protein